MHTMLVLLLAVQQWTTPVRLSPDTLPGIHPAVCVDDVGDVWVCWYSSNQLFTRRRSQGIWSEVFLIDTATSVSPEVTTSSVCRGTYEFPAWIVAWADSDGHIRLSLCDMMPIAPKWMTTLPDSTIMGNNPAVTYDTEGKIWCAWTMTGPISYYLATYWNGSNWASPETLRQFVPVEITYTAGIIADHKGNIWVSYNDHESIWVQHYNGSSWSTPETIGACFDHAYPTMCSDSFNVWVSWFNSTANMGEGGIFGRCYNGIEWSDLVVFPHYFDPILGMGWHNSHADICVDAEGKLWAGWWETQAIWCPNYLIPTSSYKEAVWERISIVDSVVDAWGGYPSIACGNEEVWMVWQSEKEGDWNIYTSHSGITGVEEAALASIPKDFTLLESYPNPLNSFTRISYCLPKRCGIRLSIHDIQGRLIRTLFRGEEGAGTHTVVWDGRDNSGRRVSSGPYFVRLAIRPIGEAEQHTATRKLSVMRFP